MSAAFLLLCVLLIVAGLLPACTVLQPPPELVWDESPDALIVRAATVGGLQPQAAAINDLPSGLIWGDGRIVWTDYNERGERLVLEGRLSPEELRALLDEFADQGFFGMADSYRPQTEVFDAGVTSLRVNLLSESKTVSEYYEGAPAAFHELEALVASGAGAAGSPYAPQRGWLTARPVTAFENESTLEWDADALGVDLAEAANGLWVEGEPLALAWHAVNLNYWAPRVQQAGQDYELFLEVPELIGREPDSE